MRGIFLKNFSRAETTKPRLLWVHEKTQDLQRKRRSQDLSLLKRAKDLGFTAKTRTHPQLPHIPCKLSFPFLPSAHVLSRAFYRSAVNGGLCLPHNNICSYLFCLHCSFPNFRFRSSWSLIASFFRVGGATATCLGGDSPTKSSLMLLWDLNFKSQDYSPILKVLQVYHCLQGNRKKICKVKNPQWVYFLLLQNGRLFFSCEVVWPRHNLNRLSFLSQFLAYLLSFYY